MREIAVFGGPGSGGMVVQSARRQAAAGADVVIAGLLNDQLAVGEMVAGAKVLGGFAGWRTLPDATRFVAPLHKAKLMQQRVARIRGLKIPANRWASIVDPHAIIADDGELGEGSFLGPFGLLDAGAKLGRHAALWPAAQVGHDCIAEDFVFVGRGAIVCGRCRIGLGAYIGAGAVVSDGVTLGRFCVVGVGAVVARDVPDHAIVAGRPAQIIGRLDPRDDP